MAVHVLNQRDEVEKDPRLSSCSTNHDTSSKASKVVRTSPLALAGSMRLNGAPRYYSTHAHTRAAARRHAGTQAIEAGYIKVLQQVPCAPFRLHDTHTIARAYTLVRAL